MIIDGVQVTHLSTHPDERGFFREILRVSDSGVSDGVAQFSHSLMHCGVIKAWHVHPSQVDWWYVPIGALKVALHDLRDDSATKGVTSELMLGEHYGAQVLKIPAGVAHGCAALVGPTHLFLVSSKVYDFREEGRIAHDDPEIGYDWLAGPPIK
jgi:dTDP-4-dehydrorhamnose 3,5-epimerase